MFRTRLPLALLLVLPSTPLAAQSNGGDTQASIRSALSAAPASVAAHAAVMLPTGEMLREGTNGFVCIPDDPDVPNNAPMCLDAAWRELIDALMNQRAPRISGIGIAYMLQGDMPVSNVDPYATAPTADNAWIQSGDPHIMIVTSDAAALEGLSTDPDSGGPFVMWKGTPYAHIMVPTVPRPR
ncbi:MAG: hypothetical protein KY453_07805 [Gemmatimonadetes bacterium]|nr:hypothetical protein [Gemmatimonadota bacterium]